MNLEPMNAAILAIAEKRSELRALNTSPEKYETLKAVLQQMEQAFMEQYGERFREILLEVHDEICPDIDLANPLQYIANNYRKVSGYFDVDAEEGVAVAVDDYDGKAARLVVVPSPLRVMMCFDEYNKEQVWISQN